MIFVEVFKLLDENNIKPLDFIKLFIQHGNHVHIELRKAIEDFAEETRNELFETKEQFDSFYSYEGNYDNLLKGLLGKNVLFSNYAIIIGSLLDEVVESLTSTIKDCCHYNRVDIPRKQIQDIRKFCLIKLKGIFTLDTQTSEYGCFHYDILKWLGDKSKKLQDFQVKDKIRFEFYFSKEQQNMRKDFFIRYGEGVLDIAKIIARISNISNLFRRIRPS